MSYDFLLFKLKTPIQSPKDLSETSTTSIGTGAEIKAQLTSLFPNIDWHLSHGCWWGHLETNNTWYEFYIQQADTIISFSIRTSHRSKEHFIIEQVCQSLTLVAFDGQANQLIGNLRPPLPGP